MLLGFGHDPAAAPGGVLRRLGLRHIDWPTPGKRQLLEHAEQTVLAVAFDPERRYRGSGFDEFEPLAVGGLVDVDLKRTGVRDLFFEFIVPGKQDSVATHAERRAAGRDLDAPPNVRLAVEMRVASRRPFPIER